MTEINNVIVIADIHASDQLALCPPEVQLAHGGTYAASKWQLLIWEAWQHFWNVWVPKATKNEPYAVVINGDGVDGRHHNTTHQITQDKADQHKIGLMLLEPIVKKCNGLFYYLSGTEAHGGIGGEDEEKLAKALGAIPDENGMYSRYEMYMQVGKALCHFSHHIGITGSMAYETTALTKEFNEFCAESARWGRPIPDIVVRSHRHRHAEVRVPTANGYGIIFVTAAWQLKTPFIFRMPGGRVTTPMIGGSLIRQGDEEFFTRHKTWETKRSKTEILKIEGMNNE